MSKRASVRGLYKKNAPEREDTNEEEEREDTNEEEEHEEREGMCESDGYSGSE